jgi:hypothetical protein
MAQPLDTQPQDGADQATRAAILTALDLPPAALPLFFAHVTHFCHAHGGAPRYADLLALLAEYQAEPIP